MPPIPTKDTIFGVPGPRPLWHGLCAREQLLETGVLLEDIGDEGNTRDLLLEEFNNS